MFFLSFFLLQTKKKKIYSKLQIDCQHTDDTGEDWVILSLSSFTQLVPISHALWALTCFLICASHNHWIRSWYVYFLFFFVLYML